MKHSEPKSYYYSHHLEILAKMKRAREANPEAYRELTRESMRGWRKRNLELNRERQREYFRRWRDSNRTKHRAIRNAQHSVPLGHSCEFCETNSNLMRFHLDYDYPLIVVTVCRECRSWIKNKHLSSA